MTPDFDIVVIGGGMVGAAVAALAAGSHELGTLRIALLEAHPPSAPPPEREVDLRVSAISRASERIMDSLGAWHGLAPRHLSAYTDMVVWDATGRPRGPGSIHFSASATSEPNLGYIVENRRVLWAIYGSAGLRERVTVLRAELSQLVFEDTHARIKLADGRQVTARLVIAADGADSISRKLAGIETRGWQYEQRAFVTHVSTQYSHDHTAWQRFLPTGPIAFLPLADGRSSIVWTTTPDHAERLVNCPAPGLTAELHDAIGGTLGAIQVAGPRAQFPLRLTHATQYCRERFVLVGDAAHAVHPLAGQGVNLGFLDAATLIETLVQAALAEGSAESFSEMRVLRRYERRRKSENVLALGLIDGLNRLFSNSDAVLTWARRVGLSAVDRSHVAKRLLMERAMGIAGDVPAVVARPEA
jgi:2-polyprenylphenol 6-hydroxylase